MSTVGFNSPRKDGPAKATGAAQYVDDLRPEGCLYGATVRSTRAHARIVSITLDPAYDWSDITVVTAADLPGENVVHLMTDDQPVLAAGLVRHVTEPLALVAAATPARAREAARHVQVVYEDLPVVLDPARSEGASVEIFPDHGDGANVFKRIRLDKNPDAPLDLNGLLLHEGTYRVGHQEQLYIEPQGMLAVPRDDGGVTVIGSMQCPYYIQKALRRVLGHERSNVIQAATGGGFGGKEEYPSMIASHAALLALKSGRPVKVIYRRDEDLQATTKRHPAVIRIRSWTAPDGTLVRWDLDILVDGGAYNTLTPVVLSRAVLHSTGPYRITEVHIHGSAVATHSPPNGAFRGFGAPQAFFAAERHMDRIARGLGIDPLTLRRRNLVIDGDTSATGQVFREPGGFAVLEQAIAAAAEPLKPAPHHPGAGDPEWRRGRGLALVLHGCGFTGNGEAWLKGRVGLILEGERVDLLMGSTDIGQGAETTIAQIVAEELRIAVDRVRPVTHDTDLVPDSGPTVASRTCMVVGSVAQAAARDLRQALQLETGLDTDDFDALVAARGSAGALHVEHQYEDDGSLQWDGERYQGDAYPTYGWSCAIVDLDVDIDTGEVIYRRFVSATDVGRAINPVVVEGQLEGGSVQGLGYATLEEVVVDQRGLMRNDRLTNYIIPTSLDSPDMVTRLVEIPYARGPFGAKGVGEIPMDGPAPAVAQAIEQATGAVLEVLPMTPERVLQALSRRGAGAQEVS